MNSQFWVNRPFCGLACGLCQASTPRHSHPAAWIASVVVGSCRQSVNSNAVPPVLVRRWDSVMICVSQNPYDRWSMFSPVKSGKVCWASAEVYFAFAERVVRSFAVRPPELYGGR